MREVTELLRVDERRARATWWLQAWCRYTALEVYGKKVRQMPPDEAVNGQQAQTASSGEESDEATDLTLQDDQEEDGTTSDEEQSDPDTPTREWTGLKTTKLNDFSHRIIRLPWAHHQ